MQYQFSVKQSTQTWPDASASQPIAEPIEQPQTKRASFWSQVVVALGALAEANFYVSEPTPRSRDEDWR